MLSIQQCCTVQQNTVQETRFLEKTEKNKVGSIPKKNSKTSLWAMGGCLCGEMKIGTQLRTLGPFSMS